MTLTPLQSNIIQTANNTTFDVLVEKLKIDISVYQSSKNDLNKFNMMLTSAIMNANLSIANIGLEATKSKIAVMTGALNQFKHLN